MKLKSVILITALAFGGYASAAMSWVHPGTLDGKTELDYVKAQIALGNEPYKMALYLLENGEDGLSTAPSPRTTIDARNDAEANAARDDARRTYGNALAWYLTGKDAYAQQAVAYLNNWTTLQSITTSQGASDQQHYLLGGWIGSLLAPAADLMLGYSGWAAADITKMRTMFETAFYPVLKTASSWNGNVDLHQISALMAIAVFNENETWFNAGLTRLANRIPRYFYLSTDAQPSATFWSSPTKWVDGLTQETCRDNNHHAQFGLSGAIGAMETAWHQGVDVYTTYQPRMVAAMELMGLQSSTGDMQGTCANNVTSTDVYDTWEIGYNHYHARKSIDMPNTWKMITTKVRSASNGSASWNIFYETLTHASLNASTLNTLSHASNMTSFIQIQKNGLCVITAPYQGLYEVTTSTIKGEVIHRTSMTLNTGMKQVISLGTESATQGLYLVEIQSPMQKATMLYNAKAKE